MVFSRRSPNALDSIVSTPNERNFRQRSGRVFFFNAAKDSGGGGVIWCELGILACLCVDMDRFSPFLPFFMSALFFLSSSDLFVLVLICFPLSTLDAMITKALSPTSDWYRHHYLVTRRFIFHRNRVGPWSGPTQSCEAFLSATLNGKHNQCSLCIIRGHSNHEQTCRVQARPGQLARSPPKKKKNLD